MQFIPTKIHAVLDYIVGLALAASPWLFGFAHGGPETWIPVVLGLMALVYSLLTNYEGGLGRLIPMPAHLTLDFLSGALLLVSPWLFHFSNVVHWPHVIFGLFETGAALMTQHHPRWVTTTATT